MIKHIFIATIKPGVSDANVEQAIQDMRAMKDTVPEIQSLTVGRSLGWAGSADTVSMVIDVADQASFERLLANDSHQKVSAAAGEVFRTDNFVLSQISY
ncbi:Dabb family protein [Levilactobacillus angrenensis]|uniref:Dabb family protein n=1 Tax=Levilactobacillus angrenensis TaxID=2486020 RepID=A0ABW1U8A3_9LACO|nr:Dabb family protein [Levilactobacillus angrenensis]